MKITKSQLKQIIKEELGAILDEAELSPAMYNALKAKGQLPPGATVKGPRDDALSVTSDPKRDPAASSARGNIALMKQLKSYQAELADASKPGSNFEPEYVFKLKQKIAKLKQMMQSKKKN